MAGVGGATAVLRGMAVSCGACAVRPPAPQELKALWDAYNAETDRAATTADAARASADTRAAGVKRRIAAVVKVGRPRGSTRVRRPGGAGLAAERA